MPADDFRVAERHLRRQDPVLAHLMRYVGPCTLRRSRSHFGALLEAVVWQQLSWKAACAIYDRLLRSVGRRHPTPDSVIRLGRRGLRHVGLSNRKSECIIELAECFTSGRFPGRRIRRLSDEDAIDVLVELRGIGRWSAEMFLIFALNRLDVFPVGDLGLRKAIAAHYRLSSSPSTDELHEIGDVWRPYRTVAAWYLWASADGTPMQPGGAGRPGEASVAGEERA